MLQRKSRKQGLISVQTNNSDDTKWPKPTQPVHSAIHHGNNFAKVLLFQGVATKRWQPKSSNDPDWQYSHFTSTATQKRRASGW